MSPLKYLQLICIFKKICILIVFFVCKIALVNLFDADAKMGQVVFDPYILFSTVYWCLYFYLDVNGVYIICNTKLYSMLKPHRI